MPESRAHQCCLSPSKENPCKGLLRLSEWILPYPYPWVFRTCCWLYWEFSHALMSSWAYLWCFPRYLSTILPSLTHNPQESSAEPQYCCCSSTSWWSGFWCTPPFTLWSARTPSPFPSSFDEEWHLSHLGLNVCSRYLAIRWTCPDASLGPSSENHRTFSAFQAFYRWASCDWQATPAWLPAALSLVPCLRFSSSLELPVPHLSSFSGLVATRMNWIWSDCPVWEYLSLWAPSHALCNVPPH